MDYKEFIKDLDRLFSIGNTTEHSFRGSLQSFLSALLPGYVVTNEPRRRECGAPDYVVTKKGTPVAFFEAKDIDDGDLDGRKAHRQQYFGNVSDLAWNFFIGGYQPAQKWLKDRKGRTLEYEDILHYGRIIYALEQTDRIMKEIDEIYATV